MKIICFILSIFLFTMAQGQGLNLKKDQKFSYEYFTNQSSSSPNQYLDYHLVDFQVIKNTPENTRLSVLIRRRVQKYSSYTNDSDRPISSFEENPNPVMDSVMSQIPFYITINKSGTLLKVEGLDSIKSIVSKELKRLNIQEFLRTITAQTVNFYFSDYRIKNIVKNIFGNREYKSQKVFSRDTTYFRNGIRTSSIQVGQKVESISHPTLDTIHLKITANTDRKTGLLQSLTKDSIAKSMQVDNNLHRSFDLDINIVLVSSNIKSLVPIASIFPTVKLATNIDQYYSTEESDLRQVTLLSHYFLNNKGKLDIQKEVISMLFPLDARHKADDYAYQAARLGILMHVD